MHRKRAGQLKVKFFVSKCSFMQNVCNLQRNLTFTKACFAKKRGAPLVLLCLLMCITSLDLQNSVWIITQFCGIFLKKVNIL